MYKVTVFIHSYCTCSNSCEYRIWQNIRGENFHSFCGFLHHKCFPVNRHFLYSFPIFILPLERCMFCRIQYIVCCAAIENSKSTVIVDTSSAQLYVLFKATSVGIGSM